MRLVRRPSKVDTLAIVLNETIGYWTKRQALAYMEANSIPEGDSAVISEYILKHPQLAFVSDAEFVAAMLQVRPDLAAELQTDKGRAWMKRVPRMLMGNTLKSIFAPGGTRRAPNGH